MPLIEIIQKKVFVIAEIGKNFIETREERPVAEYLENAKKLVKAAKAAGADAVKFQTHNVEDEQLNITVTSPHFKGADRYSWVTRNTHATPLNEFWRPLKAYCDESGIIFHSTPMSRGAAKILQELDVPFWKVGSGDILDFVMLDFLASTKKPIIISSGMSTLEELDLTMDFLKRRNAEVILLHCVSKYPCPPEELRLATIDFLHKRYGVIIGFSDHSIGIDSAFAAVALGARVIEKHFSLSRDLWGADHKVSMTPEEMRELVTGIRAIEQDAVLKSAYLQKDIVKQGMGTSEKVLQEDEAVFRPFFRKSLMASRDLAAGTVLASDDLYAMRPQQYAGGLPSEQYEKVLGKRVSMPLKKFDPITSDILSL
ncbi:MAG: N-acetylneuraminate synthase family protein [Candidatus Sungbacteria bacterium]|nr:N-acetylneuraminate synthase family protein [bacterium]MDZ4260663.1 N-acetylneuraminate synthase family protein [Candidatus Sungbacteria bacterium]